MNVLNAGVNCLKRGLNKMRNFNRNTEGVFFLTKFENKKETPTFVKNKVTMARDLFHDIVKKALIKDGWTITHDPFTLHSRKEGGLSTDIGAV